MTDRELLELAYRAYRPGENYTRLVNDAGPDYWNPLINDGDALRLVVKLDICRPYDKSDRVCVWLDCTSDFIEELHGDDPYAATRRAIVRAAAAIGEAMP